MTDTPVNTAIGTDKFKSEPVKHEARMGRTQTFKRICQHYVTNNNTSIAPTVTVVTNAASGNPVTNFNSDFYAVFDQGFVNIPFLSTSMAMDASNWDEIQASCSKFRVVGCGFKVFRIQASQQLVGVAGGTSTVTNQFTQAPTLMMVKDWDHVLSDMSTTQDPTITAPSNCNTVNLVPGIANKSFAHSFTNGQLPKIFWLQPCSAGTSFSAETSFDIMKGGQIEWLSTSDHYHYHWENPDKNRWNGPMQLGNVGSFLNDETVRQLNYYGTSATQPSIVCAIQQNLATDVNRNLESIPCSHFIRVPPLYSQVGAVTVTLEIMIEYTMTIEWVPGNYLTTRTVTGGDGSMLAGNILPYTEYRRNMLAFAAGNIPPPSLRGDNRKRKSNDTPGKENKEPAAKAKPDDNFNAIGVPTSSRLRKDAVDGNIVRKQVRYIELADDEEYEEDC